MKDERQLRVPGGSIQYVVVNHPTFVTVDEVHSYSAYASLMLVVQKALGFPAYQYFYFCIHQFGNHNGFATLCDLSWKLVGFRKEFGYSCIHFMRRKCGFEA